MKKKAIYIYTAIISVIFVILIFFTATFLIMTANQPKIKHEPSDTEVLYVYVTDEIKESETESFAEGKVAEYNGRIGIFSSDGTLLQMLETYVKTLPEADRTALREGILISSEEELYSVIEAYTD